MPLYEIQHVCPLTETQQDELAEGITRLHSTKFSTPRLFVNVKFTDYSDKVYYVGGTRKTANHIIANVRVGPSRTQKDWDDLTAELVEIWDGIVPMPQAKGSKQQNHTLRTFFILGGMVGGYEAGFTIPPAGGDREWLRDHMEEFKTKAAAGDQEFADLVKEVKERGLMDGVNGTNGVNGH